MSRKDRRLYFYFACSSSEAFVWLLYLLLSFTLCFCKLTEENSRKQRGLATDVSQGQACLLPSFLPTFLPCLLIFLWFRYCTSFCPLAFLSTIFPEEVSRKHGSRIRRLARTDVCNDARPDVSPQTSRKDRRTYFLLFLCLFIFLALGSVLVPPWSFVSLTCLCTSYLKKCLASTGLATDVLLRDVSQGQTSRKGSRKARRLATDVSQGQACLLTPFLPTFLPCLHVHLSSLWFGYCTSFCP